MAKTMLKLRGNLLIAQGFTDDSAGKESTCNAGDVGLILGTGKSLEEGMTTHASILA